MTWMRRVGGGFDDRRMIVGIAEGGDSLRRRAVEQRCEIGEQRALRAACSVRRSCAAVWRRRRRAPRSGRPDGLRRAQKPADVAVDESGDRQPKRWIRLLCGRQSQDDGNGQRTARKQGLHRLRQSTRPPLPGPPGSFAPFPRLWQTILHAGLFSGTTVLSARGAQGATMNRRHFLMSTAVMAGKRSHSWHAEPERNRSSRRRRLRWPGRQPRQRLVRDEERRGGGALGHRRAAHRQQDEGPRNEGS